jgi:hypothetical protein
MCDYSLDFVASRPAKVGDKLISTRFEPRLARSRGISKKSFGYLKEAVGRYCGKRQDT